MLDHDTRLTGDAKACFGECLCGWQGPVYEEKQQRPGEDPPFDLQAQWDCDLHLQEVAESASH